MGFGILGLVFSVFAFVVLGFWVFPVLSWGSGALSVLGFWGLGSEFKGLIRVLGVRV